MADAALFFLWASFVAAGFAALASVLYALQPRLRWSLAPRRVVATEPSVPLPAAEPIRSATLGGVATLSVWTAATLGIVGLIMRSIALNHAPYSNLFEFSMAFGIAIVLLYGMF